MNKEKSLKLHLGCGEEYLEGYVNIDFPPDEHSVMAPKADIYQDIKTLSYPENSVDEIRNHHLFEHFSRVEALKLLLQWRRWLKSQGGVLVIETPDFGASARAYVFSLSRRKKMRLGRQIFGSQEAGWAYHLDFWDKGKFKFVLKKLGFKNLKFRRYRNRLAQRYPHIPFLNILGNILPESFYKKYGGHKMPSIVVTAEKDGNFALDEKAALREILSRYLVGKEGEELLSVWLK